MVAQPAALAPAAPGVAPRARVDSDVDRLAAVLLHRPGHELAAVDPQAPEAALFAAPADAHEAGRAHDAFAGVLRDRGVEVLDVERLAAEVIARPDRARAFLRRALPDSPEALRARLGALAPADAARALVGGVDGPGPCRLAALPNLLYTRDTSAWVGARPLVGTMAAPSRRREAALVAAVYDLHPRFAGLAARPRARTPLEGGDVLVAGDGRVLVGLSERTSAAAARRVVADLLGDGSAAEVVTVTVPPAAGFHLDLMLTLVDRDTFAVWAPVRRTLAGRRWRRTPRGDVVGEPVDDALAGATVIELDGRDAHAHGRHWDHGVNVLAIAPGVVVAYEENVRAVAALRAGGVEVLTIPSAGLAAGRGGPRCLSCPVARG